MNKKTHAFLFVLLLILVLYLCKDKIIHLVEPFGNQIIIQPDGSFDSQGTTFSILTYDSDIESGVTQASICSDDNSWTKADMTCREYSLVGSNCDDIGDDGRSALDACKVACDNCLTYKDITRKLPSPVEDTEEPSYAQFESSGDDFGGAGGDLREVMDRLHELDQKVELLSSLSSSGADADADAGGADAGGADADAGGADADAGGDADADADAGGADAGADAGGADADAGAGADDVGVVPAVDCAGTWSACTSACETANIRTWNETIAQAGTGMPCPPATDCQPGEGSCLTILPDTQDDDGGGSGGVVPAVDCAGTWSACTSACEAAGARVWAGTAEQSGTGAACPQASACQPGDGACPQILSEDQIVAAGETLGVWLEGDCIGTWSSCTEDCIKTYSITSPQRLQGKECEAVDGETITCQPGIDDCPTNSESTVKASDHSTLSRLWDMEIPEWSKTLGYILIALVCLAVCAWFMMSKVARHVARNAGARHRGTFGTSGGFN